MICIPPEAKCAIIANGVIKNYDALKPIIRQYDVLAAADGGLNHCHAMGLVPHLIVGDYDSVEKHLLPLYAQVPKLYYHCHKDQTDLELAIKAIFHSGASKLTIFGALENRTDHALYNLHLLRRNPGKICIESETELVFCIKGSTTLSSLPGQTLSLIPFGPAGGITTNGLKWELKNASFDKNFMSISNICLNSTVEISVPEGDLICCLQKP